MELINTKVEQLPVRVYSNRREMGRAAARDAAERIRAVIGEKGSANVVFAAAPSQDDLLQNLLQEDIDWTHVRGFHQDEYIALDPRHPAGFGNYLRRTIFDKVPFQELYFLECGTESPEQKCAEYTALLAKYPPDLIFLGVGENGHLAFNDPSVADFDDPQPIKIVELDDICRQQQVNDGCFDTLAQVPHQAITLTLSAIRAVPQAIAVVPTTRKAKAIHAALQGPVDTACPASCLRRQPGAALYLDRDSAALTFDLPC